RVPTEPFQVVDADLRSEAGRILGVGAATRLPARSTGRNTDRGLVLHDPELLPDVAALFPRRVRVGQKPHREDAAEALRLDPRVTREERPAHILDRDHRVDWDVHGEIALVVVARSEDHGIAAVPVNSCDAEGVGVRVLLDAADADDVNVELGHGESVLSIGISRVLFFRKSGWRGTNGATSVQAKTCVHRDSARNIGTWSRRAMGIGMRPHAPTRTSVMWSIKTAMLSGPTGSPGMRRPFGSVER